MNLIHLRYTSEALGRQTACYVLQPDYTKAPHYVMFLLHGLWGDYTDWQRKSSIERYVDEQNLMVVMADGGRGFYLDAVEGQKFGTAIGLELPALIEGTFQVHTQFAITGLSMGGYGAVRLAFNHPQRFVSSVSHSGAFYASDFIETDNMEWNKEIRRLVGTSPNGSSNDLLHLAKSLPASQRPALRLDCGTEDHLIEINRRFHSDLNLAGYPHEYEEFSGAHNWEYWDEHVKQALSFHRRTLPF